MTGQSEHSSHLHTAPAPGRGRLHGLLKIAAAGFLLFATCGPSVMAEDDTAASFFRADRERMQQQQRPNRVLQQRPTHLIRRAAPVPGFTVDVPAQPDGLTPAPTEQGNTPAGITADTPSTDPQGAPQATAPTVTADKPAEGSFAVAVIGDSLGQLLGQGLAETFADRPEVAILRKAKESTGLVRDDYFDWVKGARDLVAGPERINAAVIMIGSNDRQQIRDAAGAYDLHTPRWTQIYGDRVEAIAQAFRERRIPLIWVGLPVMKGERFSADMEQFNEIYRDRAGKAGAVFVDTWDAFLDDRGQYAPYGPDVNGQFQKLRSADGVHFTRPGARKLANFVETELKRLMEDARPQVDPALVSVDPQATREPPALAVAPPPVETPGKPADIMAVIPLPAPTPDVVIAVKPAAGAVSALTGPVLSPGGELVAATRRVNGAIQADALLEKALIQGRPLDPRPGRADDFSWPRR